jgi:hypothetical protein
MKKKLFAHITLPLAIMLGIAVLITLLTGLVARIGDEYKCDHSDFVEQARDARGIPLIYLQRSVQHTYCSPVLMNGSPVPNYGRHIIDTTAIFVDVMFWFILLVGIRALILRIDKINR